MKKLILLSILLIILIGVPVLSAPPSCGDGKCIGLETCTTCPADCGACPPTPTPTEVGTAASVSTTKPLHIFPKFPLQFDTLKRGKYTFQATLYSGGSSLESGTLKAESEIFENKAVTFKPNRDACGMGCWTADAIIGKNIKKGQYKVLYTASYKGDKNEVTNDIYVNPVLNISTKLESNYSKGRTIKFFGRITDFTRKEQVDKDVEIIAYHNNIGIFKKTLKTDQLGEFKYDYFIDFADPDGIWDITIESKDEFENIGLLNFKPEIKFPKGTAYYTINFLSPIKDFYYMRGEVIPINVEVRENEELITDANVNFISPQQRIFPMKEIEPGIYAVEYKIDWNDPTGLWNLKVGAEKKSGNKTKVGGMYLPINIKPGEIKLDIIDPALNIVFPGTRMKFRIKATQPDGKLAQGADILVKFSNNDEFELIESRKGVYTGSYSASSKDIGTLEMEITAEDTKGNKGSIPITTVYVKKANIVEIGLVMLYTLFIKKYWWAILLFIITAGIIYKPSLEIDYLNRKIRKAQNEIRTATAMQIASEKKYYKERSITKEEFKELMAEYEKRLAKAHETEEVSKEQLDAKIKKYKEKIKPKE